MTTPEIRPEPGPPAGDDHLTDNHLTDNHLTEVSMVDAQGHRLVVGAAIVDDLLRPRQLLAGRRTQPPSEAGGWELPGGKVDPGETPVEALHRELREELGVAVVLGERLLGPLTGGGWPLGDDWAMLVWLVTITAGEPAPLQDHDQLRWLSADDLRSVPWLTADLPILDAFATQVGWPPSR